MPAMKTKSLQQVKIVKSLRIRNVILRIVNKVTGVKKEKEILMTYLRKAQTHCYIQLVLMI